MNTLDKPDSQSRLRRSIYFVLIAASVGVMLGRILAVDAVDKTAIQEFRIQSDLKKKEAVLARTCRDDAEFQEKRAAEEQRLRERIYIRRPFFSANDRSRWCTIRVLVEPELQVEGAPFAIDKVIQEPNWDTIDMVKHKQYFEGGAAEDLDRDEDDERIIRNWDGKQVDGHVYSSKPPLLPTLIAAEYWAINRLTGKTLGTHPFAIGRFMLITINVIPLFIAFWLLGRLVERLGTSDWGRMFVMAAAAFGTFLTTFAVTLNNHVPAAVCAVVTLYAAVRIWFDDERRWWYFAVAGFFGAMMAANELPALSLFALLGAALLWKAPRPTLLAFVPAAAVVAVAFFGTNWIAHKSLVPAYLHRGGGGEDDWYDYTYIRATRPGEGIEHDSYWLDPQGVDKGESRWSVYAFNVVVGHHGIFSLTPVWLLSVAGVLMWLKNKKDRPLRELALAIGAVSAVCLAFLLYKWQTYGNYGGLTCGLRWVFWLAPLWLLAMLPAVDALAARAWTRGLALALLAVSVLSASYATWNPWTHPWLMDFAYYMGWIAG